MIKTLCAATLALAAALPVQAADVGVSVSISQPGVYGRVDIGRFPQPVLVQPQPVWVARQPVVAPPPAYMWVPPGHQRHWRAHCGRYQACGVPVYFVQNRWYNDHVMAGQHRNGRHAGAWREHERGHDRGPRRGGGRDMGYEEGRRHGGGHRD